MPHPPYGVSNSSTSTGEAGAAEAKSMVAAPDVAKAEEVDASQ